jgi:hypothetical protein
MQTQTVEPKLWYHSKTILINSAVVLAAIAAVLATPELQQVIALLPAVWQPILGAAIPFLLAVINIWLRFTTTQPVVTSGD